MADPDTAKAKRAMGAMLKMVKLDIAAFDSFQQRLRHA